MQHRTLPAALFNLFGGAGSKEFLEIVQVLPGRDAPDRLLGVVGLLVLKNAPPVAVLSLSPTSTRNLGHQVLARMINADIITPKFLPASQSGAGSTSTSLPTGGFGFEKPVEGNTNDWLTPPALLASLGTFDLDPCGCAGMPWRTATTTHFLPDHDGLVEPWQGRVFCNPPYGPNVGSWARRMAEHGNGIMLIFARTETTTWQQDIFPIADSILFLSGRVRFRLRDGQQSKSGTAPSVLLAYGQNNVEALRNAGLAGALYLKAEILYGVKASLL